MANSHTCYLAIAVLLVCPKDQYEWLIRSGLVQSVKRVSINERKEKLGCFLWGV